MTTCITKNSRQYRTINGYRLCRTPSLHIFRHPVQISFDRRKPACTQFMQSDDKSVCPKVSFCFSAKHCQLLRNRCTISPPRTNPPTTALSLSLFVGERACPSRHAEPLHSHDLLKSTSTATPRTKLASLAKGEVLLLGQAEPTMEGIEINRSTTLKISKH